MDVFDSNIWIYALTQTCEDAVALVERTLGVSDPDMLERAATTHQVGVSAYIYDEVMTNLQRSTQSQQRSDRIQTRFADLVYGNNSVNGPSQREIAHMDIAARRRDPTVQTMAAGFGIQAKDVPVIVFAKQYAE